MRMEGRKDRIIFWVGTAGTMGGDCWDYGWGLLGLWVGTAGTMGGDFVEDLSGNLLSGRNSAGELS